MHSDPAMTEDDHEAVVMAVGYRLQAKWKAPNIDHAFVVKTTVAVMESGEWRQFVRAEGT